MAYIGPLRLFILGALAYLIALGALGYRVWTGSRNPWLRRTIVLSLLVGIPLIVAAGVASRHFVVRTTAVVTDGSVGVFDAPEADASRITIYEGLVIRVVGERDGWAEVRLPDGNTGWIDRQSIEEV
jgi:hypothetical protein